MLVALALPPVNYPTTPVAGRKSVKQMIDVVCYPRLEIPKSKERNTVESIKFLQKNGHALQLSPGSSSNGHQHRS